MNQEELELMLASAYNTRPRRPLVSVLCGVCSRRTVADVFETGRGALFVGEFKAGPSRGDMAQRARSLSDVSTFTLHLLEDPEYLAGLESIEGAQLPTEIARRTLFAGYVFFACSARCPRGCGEWQFEEVDLLAAVAEARTKRKRLTTTTANLSKSPGEIHEILGSMIVHPSSDLGRRDPR